MRFGLLDLKVYEKQFNTSYTSNDNSSRLKLSFEA
jgi:hypothetical protein